MPPSGRQDKQTIQELVSDISHQVKTPTANIQMITGILNQHELSPDKRQEFLDLPNRRLPLWSLPLPDKSVGIWHYNFPGLNTITGLYEPTEGTVIVDGMDLSKMREEQLTVFRRRKIGFVFQGYNLIPELTVKENIVFPLALDLYP